MNKKQGFFTTADDEARAASQQGTPIIVDEDERVAGEQKVQATESIISFIVTGMHKAYTTAEAGQPTRYEGLTADDWERIRKDYPHGVDLVEFDKVKKPVEKIMAPRVWKLETGTYAATLQE